MAEGFRRKERAVERSAVVVEGLEMEVKVHVTTPNPSITSITETGLQGLINFQRLKPFKYSRSIHLSQALKSLEL